MPKSEILTYFYKNGIKRQMKLLIVLVSIFFGIGGIIVIYAGFNFESKEAYTLFKWGGCVFLVGCLLFIAFIIKNYSA